MSDKLFDAFSLAEVLDHPADQHDWHAWLDKISYEQIEFVRGKLVMHFGRLNSPFLLNNDADYVREHVRSLELQLSQWIDSPEAFIDHFVIAKYSVGNEQWWWTYKHVDYWKIKGINVDPVPINVRLIPLCGCVSFSEFEERFYAPVRNNICTRVVEMLSSERESLLESIESVYEFLDIVEDEELGDLVNHLRKHRVNQFLTTFANKSTHPLMEELVNKIEKMTSKDYLSLRPSIERQYSDLLALTKNAEKSDNKRAHCSDWSGDNNFEWWREQP